MTSQANLSTAEQHFRELMLAQSGTLSNWATWDGNHFWTSSGRDASIAYRKSGRVALVVTEPLGGLDHVSLGEFITFCRSEKLTPSFYCADHQTKELLRTFGWKHLEIGKEALIRPEEFGKTKKLSRVIRHVNSRAQRIQVSAHWKNSQEIDDDCRTQIETLLNESNRGRRMPALGFTIGNGRELSQPNVAVILAINSKNEVCGFTSWLPVYRDGKVVGRTLETIARKRHSFSGIGDYMIAASIQRFSLEGLEIASLSGVPLARHHSDSVTKISRGDFLLKSLGRILEPIYGVSGLLRFKHKFNPHYRDLYLVFPKSLDLPKILVAVALAYFRNY